MSGGGAGGSKRAISAAAATRPVASARIRETIANQPERGSCSLPANHRSIITPLPPVMSASPDPRVSGCLEEYTVAVKTGPELRYSSRLWNAESMNYCQVSHRQEDASYVLPQLETCTFVAM